MPRQRIKFQQPANIARWGAEVELVTIDGDMRPSQQTPPEPSASITWWVVPVKMSFDDCRPVIVDVTLGWDGSVCPHWLEPWATETLDGEVEVCAGLLAMAREQVTQHADRVAKDFQPR